MSISVTHINDENTSRSLASSIRIASQLPGAEIRSESRTENQLDNNRHEALSESGLTVINARLETDFETLSRLVLELYREDQTQLDEFFFNNLKIELQPDSTEYSLSTQFLDKCGCIEDEDETVITQFKNAPLLDFAIYNTCAASRLLGDVDVVMNIHDNFYLVPANSDPADVIKDYLETQQPDVPDLDQWVAAELHQTPADFDNEKVLRFPKLF